MEKRIHGEHRESVDWHDADGPLRAPTRFERPKIVCNERTKQYVLWCHDIAYPGAHGFEAGHIPSLFCEKEYKP